MWAASSPAREDWYVYVRESLCVPDEIREVFLSLQKSHSIYENIFQIEIQIEFLVFHVDSHVKSIALSFNDSQLS